MRIVLCGACGRMGKAIAELSAEKNAEIVCGVDLCPSPAPYPVYPSVREVCEEADVFVDFSSPEGLGERLAFCAAHGLPAVLGFTGGGEAEEAIVQKYAARIAIFRTGNFSVGIHLLQVLVRRAAKMLGDGFDAEIVEVHHNQKKDAPSGTAKMLAASIDEGFGGGTHPVYGREGFTGTRDGREIGIHAVRGGNIAGEHTVLFAGRDEIITISHSARSRAVFAEGALRAAVWIAGRGAGLYGMDDLLGA